MTLDARLSGIWHFQRVTLECLCHIATFQRNELKRNDYIGCPIHHLANVRIVAASPATLAEREELTRDNAIS
jgi:hypothetical protein